MNLFLAILPTILITAFILWHDRYEKEPKKLLAVLFLLGIAAVLPALLLEGLYPVSSVPTLFSIFLEAFIGVALIEEGVKYAAVCFAAYKHPAYNEIYDGIIYCVMVSLGFATVENILYVARYGASTALIRAITAVPAHAIFAVSMGYNLSMSKVMRNCLFYKWKALLAPTFLHGVYDLILFANFDYALLLFIPYVIYLYIRALKLIKGTYRIEPFQ